MTATCPVCRRRQDDGIVCHACTCIIEYELGDEVQGVAALVAELNTTLARQGRGELNGKGGLANERAGYHSGASIAAGALSNTLTTWARDLTDETWRPWPGEDQIIAAAVILLAEITAIRSHPDAAGLHDEVVSSVRQARNAIDRAANRTIITVGPCPEQDENGQWCPGEVLAYIPTEDDRPSRMECKADGSHKWTSIQWLRTGKRIVDRIAMLKKEARLRTALYGEDVA